MTGKRRFEEQLAALEELREQSPEESIGPLRKALGNHNNYIVAKAADLVREFGLIELVPELTAAFDHFFTNPVKTDPQCWAKNGLSRALAALEFQDAAVFLRGARHVQLEPVWGGQSDTAGTLRATCTLALVQCRDLSEPQLLTFLIERFKDKDKSVRIEAIRAVEQVGSSPAALLLRLRAVLAGDEPEVLGACYNAILHIDGTAAIPWISYFLAAGDAAAAEAALAIASDRSPQAFDALRERLLQEHDPWFQSVLLSAIGLTRQQAAIDFLFNCVRTGSPYAQAAIEAILQSMRSPEIIKHLEVLVAGNQSLARVVAGQAAKLGLGAEQKEATCDSDASGLPQI
jgi:HEAT repeat protein